MKMNKTLITLALAGMSINSFAACIQPTETEYIVFDIATVINNTELTTQLSQKYCYNHAEFLKIAKQKGNADLFKIPTKVSTLEQFKLFYPPNQTISTTTNKDFDRDPLAYMSFPFHQPQVEGEMAKLLEKYNNGKTIKNNAKPLSHEEYDKILDYIANAYNKELYTFSEHGFNTNSLHYAILSNNPKVLKKLTENNQRKIYWIKNNSYGLTPIHFAFIKKMDYFPEDHDKNLIEINNLVIDNIKKENLNLLLFKGLGINISIFDFAEIMKDENPDLYKKLKAKFNITSNVPENKKKELKDSINKIVEKSNQNIILSYKTKDHS